ncbi:phage tail protein [Micromonospora echinospora]
MTQPGQGEDAGQLDLKVVADLRGFVTRLRREVNAAAAKVTAKVRVTVTTAGLRTELRRAVKEASDKAKVTATIGVRIPVADFRRAVRETAEKAKALARIGVRIPVTEMRRAVKEASDKANAKVRVDADTKPARRAIDGLKDNRVTLNLDTRDFNAKLRKAASTVASFGAVVAKGLGLSVLVSGLAAGTANLVAFAGAALTAVQAAGLLPAAVGGFAAILGTAKLAMSGVSDAVEEVFSAYGKLAAGGKLTAAEQEKLNEALAKLSPSARSAVLELGRLAPALDALRLDVQERFFRGLTAHIKSLANRYLPVLKTGLGQISSEINVGLRQALADLDTQANSSALATLLGNTASAARDLFAALGPIATGLLKIAEVGSSFLPGLTAGLADWAERFAASIDQAAEDGRLHQWISDGLSMLGQLAAMGRDVIGILQGLFAAAETAGGGGVFALVSQVLSTLNEAANSAGGQQALIALFTALSQIGSALAPVLGAVVSGLGPLARIVGDLAVAVSPGLTVLVNALADGLRLLAPAAGPVGRALSDVATALAPLLPLLGAQLANVLTVAAGALSIIAREAGPLLAVWAQMGVQLATILLPVLQQLVSGALGPATEAGLALAAAFAPLVPVIVELARVLAGQLLAYLPQIQQVFASQLVPAVIAIAQALSGAFLDALVQIAPLLPDLVSSGLQLAVAMVRLLTAVVPLLPIFVKAALFATKFATTILSVVIPAVTGLVDFAAGVVEAVLAIPDVLSSAASAVGGFFSDAWSVIKSVGASIGSFFTITLPGWISGVADWFAALPGRILSFLAALPGQLASFFMTALTQAAYWVGFGIGTVVRFFMELPGQVTAALAALGALVAAGVDAVVAWFQALPGRATTFFSALWTRARELFSAGVAAVASYAEQLPGRLSQAASDAKARVTSAFSAMWSAVKTAVSNGVSTTISTVKSIPSKLGDLGSLLVSAGKDLIRGLIDGVKSMGGAAVGAIKGVISSGIQGAKDALGIKSPSRVFRVIGQQVVQGYTIGIDRTRPSAVRAAERLAVAVTATASEVTPHAQGGAAGAADGGAAALAPLVGSLTVQAAPGGTFADQLEELMFQLRVLRRGGVVAST